jgi:hypothetical protein
MSAPQKHPLTSYVEKHKVTRSARETGMRTPNENDFCKCGGIFSLKTGTCVVCRARKTLGNRYEPGPHDYGSIDGTVDLEDGATDA